VGGADEPVYIPPVSTIKELLTMSEAPKVRPKVPEGKSRFLTTRQKPANEKGYIGYETIWESFQKEVPYSTPKKP
jgi:hypothetical protein